MRSGQVTRGGIQLAALVSIGFLAGLLFESIEGAPSAAPVSGFYDFGIVQQNAMVENRVSFVNTKTDAVTIDKIATSCGCTVVEPETKTINAGETVSLSVTYSVGSKPGPVASEVHVSLSDGSVHKFIVAAYVVGENIGVVSFGDIVNTGQDQMRVFELPWPPNLSFDVTDIDYDTKMLDVAVSKHESQRKTEFAITLKPGLPYGALQTKIDLEFDSPLFPPTSIIVTGSVLMPLEVSTYTLAAGMLPRNGEQELSFSVFSPYDLPVTITKLEVLRGRCGALQSRAVTDAVQEVSVWLLPPEDPAALVAQSVVRVHAETPDFSRTFDVEATALMADGGSGT